MAEDGQVLYSVTVGQNEAEPSRCMSVSHLEWPVKQDEELGAG